MNQEEHGGREKRGGRYIKSLFLIHLFLKIIKYSKSIQFDSHSVVGKVAAVISPFGTSSGGLKNSFTPSKNAEALSRS